MFMQIVTDFGLLGDVGNIVW